MKPEVFTEKTLAFLGTMGVRAVTKPKFYVEINFVAEGEPAMVYWSSKDTVFRVSIHATQWELVVSKPKKESRAIFYADTTPWIASDALGLFKGKRITIDKLPALFRESEKKLRVTFPRVAYVRTNLAGAKKAIAEWVKTL